MSISTLSKVANGDRRVDVDDLVALALALDVSPNAIILPGDASPGTQVHLTPARAVDARQSWQWATRDNPSDRVDIFVSYIDTDEAWAAWIGAQLEAVGQRVRMQSSNPPASGAAAVWIGRQMQAATRFVAVCSGPYLDSHWCTPEWKEALAGRTVIPLRVADCTMPPALAEIGWRDLHGLDEATARHRLLEAVVLAAAPRATSAAFPGALTAAAVSIHGPGRQPAIWNVQPRLATFTGRQGQLDQIMAGLSKGAPVAMLGLGGVGKTHLAVEYCYRHGHDYDLVWWLPAEEPGQLVRSLEELAEQAGVAVVGDAKESARAAVEQLRGGEGGRFARWLVVLDNADVPADDSPLSSLLGAAKASGGHILVTSRDPGWARMATPVEVDVLPREEAVDLLRCRAKGLSPEQAGRLAEALGDLPLALEQAGAWLAESGMPAGTYEDLLRRRAREVLTRGTAAGQVPVAATWTVALDAVTDPAAVMLVRLWAHVGPEPIPLDLLGAETAGLVPEPLATAARDPLKLGDTVAQVSRLGLVRPTGGAVVMHRLVHAVLRDHTPAAERELLCSAVVRLVAAATASGDPNRPDTWRRFARLYPHALAADLISNGDPDGRATVLRFADYLHARGDDANGDRLASRARKQWEKALGKDHPDTIVATGHLAYMLRARHDYPAARALSEDVRSRFQRVLGDDHPHTIKAGACLGAALRGLKDYSAARALFEDMLSRCRRVYGEDHQHTINAMANLAVTLRDQGNYPTAQDLLEDVLSWRRRVLGPDDPDTIKAAANLARTLRLQGDYRAAQELLEDVLPRRRRVLGPDHRHTIKAAIRLAETLQLQGDYPAARALFEDVLSRRRRILGDDDPGTVSVRKALDDMDADRSR
jgi:tetratricopeptide (TPR) repeat protein